MLEKIIDLLNMNEWYNGDEYVQVAKGKYALPKTLKDIKDYLGERYVVIVREITKIYEEIIRGNVSEVLAKIEEKPLKGEIVLIIKGLEKTKKEEEDDGEDDND